MFNQCSHYDCDLRNNAGYCKLTACINPSYNNHEISTVIKKIPKTNADLLRNATDKELARWIVIMKITGCPDEKYYNSFCDDMSCEDCWLDWLKKEVKDEHT